MNSVSDADRFADSLIAFRRDGTISPALAAPPEGRPGDATWRLMIDGRRDPSRRDAIAKLVAAWPGNTQASLEQVERLIWMGNTQEAIQVVRNLVRESQNPGGTLRRAEVAGAHAIVG